MRLVLKQKLIGSFLRQRLLNVDVILWRLAHLCKSRQTLLCKTHRWIFKMLSTCAKLDKPCLVKRQPAFFAVATTVDTTGLIAAQENIHECFEMTCSVAGRRLRPENPLLHKSLRMVVVPRQSSVQSPKQGSIRKAITAAT